jgi:hypothetical protein
LINIFRKEVKPQKQEPITKIEPAIEQLESLESLDEDKPKSKVGSFANRLRNDMSSNKPAPQSKAETVQKFELPKEEPKAQPKVEQKPIITEKPKEAVKTEKVTDFMAGLDSSFDDSKQSEGDDR